MTIAEALQNIANAISTPPNSVSNLGGFVSFLYTWQAVLISVVGFFAGFRRISTERLEKQLFMSIEESQLQSGILRAVRGEISANLYFIGDLFEESKKKNQAKLPLNLELHKSISEANHPRVGYMSARSFAMLEVLYQRLERQYSEDIAARGYLYSENLKSIVGNLIATATLVEQVEKISPKIKERRVSIDPDGIIDTQLSALPKDQFKEYIHRFEPERHEILFRFLEAWSETSPKIPNNLTS